LTYPRRGGYVDAVRDLSDFSEKERFVTQIYVGNLAYGATEDDIRQAFSEFGQVSNVSIITDRQTGRPRGFAFVEMPNAAEAKKAMESLNLKEIAGRAITVNEARPKEDRPNRGGGGGRGDRSW
jgi:RNA recognition motif-containing protein